MKLSAPRVSVVMAVFNGEAYLRQAIDSVLSQSFGDFEFLIVDDGSMDQTGAIIRSYEDPRIRIFTNPENVGLSRSLNRGLAGARGEFIARLDADDISEPERLERQVTFLDAHPEVALLGTWYTEINVRGEVLDRRPLPCDYLNIRWAMHFYCPFVHSAVMWRRALVSERVGVYDESLLHAMDFDLWIRVARLLPVANLGEHLVQLRLHPESLTMTHGDVEGHRIRLDTVARSLRWRERGLESSEVEERFWSLNALARGVDYGGTTANVLAAADEVFMLQQALCDEAGASSRERRRLRRALGRKVAIRLTKLAWRGHPNAGGLKASLQLLGTAYGIWQRTSAQATLSSFVHLVRSLAP